MTKFDVSFDTMDKSLIVKRDGEVMDSVDSVSLYKAYMEKDKPDSFYVSIVRSKRDEKNDVTYMMHITANEFEKTEYKSSIEESLANHYGVLLK